MLGVNSTLSELRLGFNTLGKGVAVLAAALAGNSTLTSLDLEGNKIDKVGAAALICVFETNSTLTNLQINENFVGLQAFHALADLCARNKENQKKRKETLYSLLLHDLLS